jgi:hypothetical protein
MGKKTNLLAIFFTLSLSFASINAAAQGEEKTGAGYGIWPYGIWPWLVLAAGLVYVLVGFALGKPRFMMSWGNTHCERACTCAGPAACTLPPPHTHCARAVCAAGCTGTCTLAAGHAGAHNCSHGNVP